MNTIFNRFVKDDSGATAIEYGLLAALISVVIIATLELLGPRLNVKFRAVADALD